MIKLEEASSEATVEVKAVEEGEEVAEQQVEATAMEEQ